MFGPGEEKDATMGAVASKLLLVPCMVPTGLLQSRVEGKTLNHTEF